MSKKRAAFLMMALLAIVMIFGGCGGGSGGDGGNGGEELVGQFIDGPVQGLTYETSSGISDVTNANGEYKYKEGDTVIFNVGNISLPSVTATSVVSPNSYYADGEANHTNLIRLLMSAGTVADGKITIDTENPPFGGKEGIFPAIFAELESEFAQDIVPAQEAKDHFAESQLNAFSGDYAGTWVYAEYSGTWAGTLTVYPWKAMSGPDSYEMLGEIGGTIVLKGVPEGDITVTLTRDEGLDQYYAFADGSFVMGGTVEGNEMAGNFASWSGEFDLSTKSISGSLGMEAATFTGKK